MEEQYKTMDHSYRDEITQIITALDHQFDSRIFDWQKQATELRSKEESFLGVSIDINFRLTKLKLILRIE